MRNRKFNWCGFRFSQSGPSVMVSIVLVLNLVNLVFVSL